MPDVVPAFEYRRELAAYRDEIDAAIARVLDSGTLILGPEVAAFESEFASGIGVSHAVGVASGTDALILALKALDIGFGDEVITVANTAVPTVSAIRATGAVPRFTDIDSATLQMCPEALSRTISAKTRCVIPVHLHGQAADITTIEQIAADRAIPIINDCAQAQTTTVHGRRVGAFGQISCYSFYPTKNLAAFGDGGMCVTNSADLASKLRELRQYGFRDDRVAHREGVCSRLDELQAAMLRVKLKHLSASQQQRMQIAARYLQELSGSSIRLPVLRQGVEHAWHQFVIRTDRRDDLCQHLRMAEIGFGIHYPSPIHLMPAYRFLGYSQGDLPQTERAATEILSLPIFAGLRSEEVDRIVEAVRSF